MAKNNMGGFVLPQCGQICSRTMGCHPLSVRRPCSSRTFSAVQASTGSRPIKPHRLLILGGTGRVGEATANAVAARADSFLEICIGGRNAQRGQRIRAKLRERHQSKTNLSFSAVVLDIKDTSELSAVFSQFDTVVHTAGPFQQRSKPADVLAQVLASDCKQYIDVCDDLSHAQISKQFGPEAELRGARCWICTGIYPGVSNLIASVMMRSGSIVSEGCKPKSVRFSYYTAGTGGIGATVLASTFLILSEDVILFDEHGVKVAAPAASQEQTIDFRGRTGKKKVFLLNLPETTSVRSTLCEGEVLAKFGTDPPIWNWLLQATARLVPQTLLRSQRLMQAFSLFSLPIVRFVDVVSGARTAIRVDVRFDDGSTGTAIYEHESLRASVGDAVGSFVMEMISASSPSSSGVFFPEELDLEVADAILTNACKNADSYSSTVCKQCLFGP